MKKKKKFSDWLFNFGLLLIVTICDIFTIIIGLIATVLGYTIYILGMLLMWIPKFGTWLANIGERITFWSARMMKNSLS